jgi:HAD superfamily hydrolase (TIGR01509 family)
MEELYQAVRGLAVMPTARPTAWHCCYRFPILMACDPRSWPESWKDKQMQDAQGLIFDCDGTLADTMPAHYRAWAATLNRYGIHFSEQRFYEWGGIPSHRIVAMLASEQSMIVDPNLVSHEKETAFLEYLDAVQPVAAVVEIARQHRGKLPMAVASGGLRPVISRILTQLGIFDWFDAIVTAEDTERHKPDPDVFLEAARRLGIPAAACLVYEDTDIGLEAARRAGMRGVDVRPMYAKARVG